MMRGAEGSWIFDVEGALEPIEGGSGICWPSRGANQDESSCWKDIFFFFVVVADGVDGEVGRPLSAVECFDRTLDDDR